MLPVTDITDCREGNILTINFEKKSVNKRYIRQTFMFNHR